MSFLIGYWILWVMLCMTACVLAVNVVRKAKRNSIKAYMLNLLESMWYESKRGLCENCGEPLTGFTPIKTGYCYRCMDLIHGKERQIEEFKKEVAYMNRYKEEACGYCCTCRWWEPKRESVVVGCYPGTISYVYRDYGPCRFLNYPQPVKDICDWCSKYEFFE